MEAKNNNQQLNDMGVIEDDGWHGGNPCPGGHFLAQDEESIKPSLRRDERAWCPLVPSAGRVICLGEAGLACRRMVLRGGAAG